MRTKGHCVLNTPRGHRATLFQPAGLFPSLSPSRLIFFSKIWGLPYPQTLQCMGSSGRHRESHTSLATVISSWMGKGPNQLGQPESSSGMLMKLLERRTFFYWVSKWSSFRHGVAGGSLNIQEGRICLRMKPTKRKTNME